MLCWRLRRNRRPRRNLRRHGVAVLCWGAPRKLPGWKSACLTAEGIVYRWGQESQSVAGPLIPTALEVGDGGPRFVSLATGGICSCAMTEVGEAWCWGFAVPVNGLVVSSAVPQPVSGRYFQISVAQGLSAQMCGVGDGGVYCWGQLQNGGTSADPVLVPGSSGLRNVTCGEGHSCALDDAGAAYCWGDNGHGQLGSGLSGFQSPVPVPVAGGHTFASISAGVFHTCAVTTAGVGYCWGGLGAVDGGIRSDPTPSPFLVSGFTFSDISAGWDWSCGIEGDGGVVCWSSSVNQFPHSLTPVRLDGGIRFLTVSTGTAVACGRGIDGLVYCWGNGPLGNGSWGTSDVPIPVAGQ
jgi:alpha-tubulin suppressor-like RCC1 family protein